MVWAGCRRLRCGLRYSASRPMRRIRVVTWRRPTVCPSCRSRSRSMRAPANGYCRCSSSIRRISASLVSDTGGGRSEEHTSELQSPKDLVCRLLLEKKKKRERSCGVEESNKEGDSCHEWTQLE